MLEYVFFDQRPLDRFSEFLKGLGLHPECRVTDREEYLVELPDDLDEPVIEQVEACYEKMMGLSEDLMAEEDDGHYSAAAVQVSLPDGNEVVASIEPRLLQKVLSVLSYDELAAFVDAVAAAAVNPDSRPICKRG
jgi:hypothetical protein